MTGSRSSAPVDRHAAGEALRVEDLEQRAEAVGVAVVRRGAEEQAVVEARARGRGSCVVISRVDGVLAAPTRARAVCASSRISRLLRARSPEVCEERVAVLGPAQQLVRDDEAVVRAPRVDAEAALLAAHGDERRVMTSKRRPKRRCISSRHCRQTEAGQTMSTKLDLLAQQQLLQHQPGLDGLAEADVVRDEEVRARQLERLLSGVSWWSMSLMPARNGAWKQVRRRRR